MLPALNRRENSGEVTLGKIRDDGAVLAGVWSQEGSQLPLEFADDQAQAADFRAGHGASESGRHASERGDPGLRLLIHPWDDCFFEPASVPARSHILYPGFL